jgi:hypothetical protein
MKMHLFAVLTLALASGIAAAAPAPAPATVDAGTAAGSEKVKCMRHRETGSNRMKKVCMSRERWNGLSEEEREAVLRSDKGVDVLEARTDSPR